ncbi:MAG TPA: radical SAM protein [Candidatus Nanoarchaeia archaeon]|nr:radical SAM protein [Candidatus Nanoarchaeia archaeon]
MKIAIVSDNGQSKVDEYTEQAMGPAYIAQSAKDNGHKVKLYPQFPSSKELLNHDLIGFSANSRDVQKVLRVSEEIKKENKGLVIVVGGPHISGEASDWLEGCKNNKNLPFLYNPSIDYSVIGEGDLTFPKLVEAISKSKEIPQGIIYKKDNEIVFTGYTPRIENLDKLSFPTDFRDPKTFDTQKTDLSKERILLIPIIESRGCPGQKGKTCSFCSSGANWGLQIRYRSGKNILKEVNEIVENFGLNPQEVNVFFDALELMVGKRNFYDILDSFKKTPYNLGSCGDIRKASSETLEKMAEAGYTDVFWGIESLDSNILNKYKAGLTIKEIKKKVSLANSFGIKSIGMLMMGFPEETKESIIKWSKGIKDLGLDSIRLSIVTPFPGTELRRDLLKKGIEIEEYSDKYDSSHLVYGHQSMGKKEAKELREEIILEFKENRF